jgi:hypothetical protein
VGTGSRKENASNREPRAPFRFNRNGVLGIDRAVAECTVKISAILGFDDLNTSGNAVRPYDPRTAIGHRKLGDAELPALRTPKIFNPTVAYGHLASMHRIPKRSYVVKTALGENQRGKSK